MSPLKQPPVLQAPAVAVASGRQPQLPRELGETGQFKTVPPRGSQLCLHLAAVTPSVQAPLSKASLGGRETLRAWGGDRAEGVGKSAHLRLQEQALSLR